MIDHRAFLKAAGLVLAGMLLLHGSRINAGENTAVSNRPLRQSHDRPNIIYILADDLGYGDVYCLNPERCRIPTPHIDAFAEQGMTFTDAHSGSSVCTPTRYGLLTGRYAWRTRLQKKVIKYGEPLIAEDRQTVAGLLQGQGYHTAGFGKWHLGLKYRLPSDETVYSAAPESLPLGSSIVGGPVERGFDQFYWFKLFNIKNRPSESNWTMIENDRVVEKLPLDGLLPRLLKRGKAYIAERAASGRPFFMYFAPPVPHTPLAPSAEWKGKNELGAYGDYVMQLDGAIGELMNTLETHGIADNTLVIITSDNGTAPYVGVGKMEEKGHYPSAQYRGYKADIWDGGHRIPFFARWPGKIKAGSTTDQLTCLTDFMATVAELLEVELEPDMGEDSVSMLPVLLAREPVDRGPIVHHSHLGQFALRNGRWKLLFCPGSGGWAKPNDKEAMEQNLPLVQLYDMERDPGEKNNLQAEFPDVVKEMIDTMESIIDKGRSTPGPDARNDVPVVLIKDV